MARQLIMLPAIAEDPGSNPSIYARWLITTYDTALGGHPTASVLHRNLHKHGAQRNSYRNTHINTNYS